MLQLSAKSIYRLAKDDPTMPMLKLGGKRGGSVRFAGAALERWLRRPQSRGVHTTRSLSAVRGRSPQERRSCGMPKRARGLIPVG